MPQPVRSHRSGGSTGEAVVAKVTALRLDDVAEVYSSDEEFLDMFCERDSDIRDNLREQGVRDHNGGAHGVAGQHSSTAVAIPSATGATVSRSPSLSQLSQRFVIPHSHTVPLPPPSPAGARRALRKAYSHNDEKNVRAIGGSGRRNSRLAQAKAGGASPVQAGGFHCYAVEESPHTPARSRGEGSAVDFAEGPAEGFAEGSAHRGVGVDRNDAGDDNATSRGGNSDRWIDDTDDWMPPTPRRQQQTQTQAHTQQQQHQQAQQQQQHRRELQKQGSNPETRGASRSGNRAGDVGHPVAPHAVTSAAAQINSGMAQTHPAARFSPRTVRGTTAAISGRSRSSSDLQRAANTSALLPHFPASPSADSPSAASPSAPSPFPAFPPSLSAPSARPTLALVSPSSSSSAGPSPSSASPSPSFPAFPPPAALAFRTARATARDVAPASPRRLTGIAAALAAQAAADAAAAIPSDVDSDEEAMGILNALRRSRSNPRSSLPSFPPVDSAAGQGSAHGSAQAPLVGCAAEKSARSCGGGGGTVAGVYASGAGCSNEYSGSYKGTELEREEEGKEEEEEGEEEGEREGLTPQQLGIGRVTCFGKRRGERRKGGRELLRRCKRGDGEVWRGLWGSGEVWRGLQGSGEVWVGVAASQ
ncbi:unnamed protein product [Closterium sp. Naga37s-1]|nr:unnamed protein product [Closterium sp. Naga37s-1]CAI5528747.1 unnamed protein product [Closterium sp. Naga37s-1]